MLLADYFVILKLFELITNICDALQVLRPLIYLFHIVLATDFMKNLNLRAELILCVAHTYLSWAAFVTTSALWRSLH